MELQTAHWTLEKYNMEISGQVIFDKKYTTRHFVNKDWQAVNQDRLLIKH